MRFFKYICVFQNKNALNHQVHVTDRYFNEINLPYLTIYWDFNFIYFKLWTVFSYPNAYLFTFIH